MTILCSVHINYVYTATIHNNNKNTLPTHAHTHTPRMVYLYCADDEIRNFCTKLFNQSLSSMITLHSCFPPPTCTSVAIFLVFIEFVYCSLLAYLLSLFSSGIWHWQSNFIRNESCQLSLTHSILCEEPEISGQGGGGKERRSHSIHWEHVHALKQIEKDSSSAKRMIISSSKNCWI